MRKHFLVQWTIEKTGNIDSIPRWFDAFLIDRRAQELSEGTLRFYRDKLKLIDAHFSAQGIANISEITPLAIRTMLIALEADGHNRGGVHQVYRALKAFLNWYKNEESPANWIDPLRNIKPPKLPETPLQPIETKTIKKLISVCGNNFTGIRDQALILFLLDTGARASEVVSLDCEDVDVVLGTVLIRSGKGNKFRTVVFGRKCRKALRSYLRVRNFPVSAFWTTDDGDRLTYWGLNQVLRRRAKKAGIEKPELHSFRRAFALNCLRNGMDIYSLQRLMGHADLQVLRRYLAQTDDDLRLAHAKASPVDNWF